MTRSQRTKYITKHLPNIKVLQKYKDPVFLAEGTVGSVYLVCKSKSECYAVKIQILYDQEEERQFLQEVLNQRDCYPKAPAIFLYSVEPIGMYNGGILVMEVTKGELDKFLEKKRSKTELDKVIQSVSDLLQFAKDKQMIHGDLALFNLSFVNRPESGKELVFIDFDRASTKHFAKFQNLDSIRIISELYENSRSKNTKELNDFNVQYLMENGIPIWKTFGNLTKKDIDPSLIDDRWTQIYCLYCKAAKIKCLDKSKCAEAIAKMKKTSSKKLSKTKGTVSKKPTLSTKPAMRKKSTVSKKIVIQRKKSLRKQ